MKKIHILLLGLVLLLSTAFADMGKLSIITEQADAKIYVDGTYVANDSIKNFPVEYGQHYIHVMQDNKKIYAKQIEIFSPEPQVIVTSRFVGVAPSSKANRGAVDQEAHRVKDTRGYAAFGMLATRDCPALSFKQWLFNSNWGYNIYAYPESTASYQKTLWGARVMLDMGNKLLFDDVVSTYVTIGLASLGYDDKTATNADYNYSLLDGMFGIEWGLANLYFSAEAGIEFKNKGSSSETSMKLAGGVHYYF